MQSRALVTFIAHFAKNMFGLFKKRALRKFRLVWYARLKINTSKYTILVVCWSRKNDTTTRAHMLARVDQHSPFTQRCTVYYMINNGFPLLRDSQWGDHFLRIRSIIILQVQQCTPGVQVFGNSVCVWTPLPPTFVFPLSFGIFFEAFCAYYELYLSPLWKW